MKDLLGRSLKRLNGVMIVRNGSGWDHGHWWGCIAVVAIIDETE